MNSERATVRFSDRVEPEIIREVFNRSRAGTGCYGDTKLGMRDFGALLEGEAIHIAELNGKLVGFVSVWAVERFIHHLYVLPEHQGRGVGGALLKACEDIYGLPLSLKCDFCNEAARRFYRNRGWHPLEQGVGDNGPWERLCLSRE